MNSPNNAQLKASNTSYVMWLAGVVLAIAVGWLTSKSVAVTALLGGITLIAALSRGVIARNGAQIKDGVLTFTDESEGLNAKKIEANLSDIQFVYLGNKAKFSETVGTESRGSYLPSAVLAGLISPAGSGAAAAQEYQDMFFVVTKDNIIHKFNAGPFSKDNCRSFLESLKSNGVATFVKAGLF